MDDIIQVGDFVKAYDFEPCPGRRDIYVIGEVVKIEEETDKLKVKVYKDTTYLSKLKREFIWTPKPGYIMFEWKGRITKIG